MTMGRSASWMTVFSRSVGPPVPPWTPTALNSTSGGAVWVDEYRWPVGVLRGLYQFAGKGGGTGRRCRPLPDRRRVRLPAVTRRRLRREETARPLPPRQHIGVDQRQENAETDQHHLAHERGENRTGSHGPARCLNETVLEHGGPPSGPRRLFRTASPLPPI